VAKEQRYRFAQVDICDAPAVRAIIEQFRPDIVMHLAAGWRRNLCWN
jgi:dTDP-glucose 4,6-dehydratase